MKKVIVIGCPGSGKTTFAEKLHTAVGLPLMYLDALWHLPDKTHISRDEFDRRLGDILSGEEWILDGNYSRTLERRLAACDTVFLFDLPAEVCLSGAIGRLGQARRDMPWVDDVLDPKLEAEIREFPEKVMPGIYDMLGKYADGREIVVFTSRKMADDYLTKFYKRT